jgi:hypothetical protein
MDRLDEKWYNITVMAETLRTPAELNSLEDALLTPIPAYITQGGAQIGEIAVTGRVLDGVTVHGAMHLATEAAYNGTDIDGPIGVEGTLVNTIRTQALERRAELEEDADQMEAASDDEFNVALVNEGLFDDEDVDAPEARAGTDEDEEPGVAAELDEGEGAQEAEVVVTYANLEFLGDLLMHQVVVDTTETTQTEEPDVTADFAETDEVDTEVDARETPILLVRQPEANELDDLAHGDSMRALGDLGLVRTVDVGNDVLIVDTLTEAQEFDLAMDRTVAFLALLGLAQREAPDEVLVGAN